VPQLADSELYLSDYEEQLVILEEIHRLAGILKTPRGLIDLRKQKGKRSGQFFSSERALLISCSCLRKRLRAE
jgi:hypothetical protein